jgi:hypothetical protein
VLATIRLHQRRRHLVSAAALTLAVLSGLTPRSLGAQDMPADTVRSGTITGTVLDAATGAPLPGATVALAPVADGVLITREHDAFWSAGAATRTDERGRYRFDRLPLGRYSVHVRRLGYRPAQVTVNLGRAAPFQVSVGLEVVPIALEPEEITVPAVPFGSAISAREPPTARLAAADYRNRRFLTNDSRVITRGELLEAVTLGESDLFRAIHRLPGVSTRDDFTAELWTRGAPWSQTMVYFDGMPLYNPLHASGIFSAVNPDALGAVLFLPGVRSPHLGDGAAAVIDLHSRPAAAERWSGAAELSAVSTRATLDRRFSGGRGGVMFAARRSYVDLVMDALAGVTGDSALRIPYSFLDGAARVTLPLGRAAIVDASGLFAWDYLRGDVRRLIRDSRGSWGNAAGRVSVVAPLGDLLTRTTIGASRFRGQLERLVTAGSPLPDSAPVHSRTDNRLDYTKVETSIEPAKTGDRTGWSAGIQLESRTQFYDGPFPRPYPSDIVYDSLQVTARRSSVALWGDTRWSIGDDFTFDVGLRVELGDSAAGVPAVTLAPRIAARYAISGARATVSAGYGGSYQHTQAVAPAGPEIGPDLHLTDVWLLAGGGVPAVKADVFTLGIEGWLTPAWMAGVNLYRRFAAGMTVPDPTPGLYTNHRPVFVAGRNRASGVELSARKLVGRWTGSLAYSYGFSTITAEGLDYPSPADRRSVFDATVLYSVGSSVRVGGAASVASGAPYTRFIIETIPCDSLAGPCPAPAGALTIEEPNDSRAPTYTTASLWIDWSKQFRSWALGIYVQVLNVLGRRNAVTYVGSLGGCEQPPEGLAVIERSNGICDLFDRGLPLLPLAGVTVAF